MDSQIAVRRFLQHHAGHPVKRCRICSELHLTRGGLVSIVDHLTHIDHRIYEEDDGRLNYLSE